MSRALVLAVVAFLAAPPIASAQAPVPLAPADGQVFAWEDVELNGVRLVVEAPAGLSVEVDLARDPTMDMPADVVPLEEGDVPGRYEGDALTLLYDEREDAGTYYWQAWYYDPNTEDEDVLIAGPVRAFHVRPPPRPASLTLEVPARMVLGRSRDVRLRYRPGSEPGADRLHLLATRADCPSAPDSQAGFLLVKAAVPPPDGVLRAPVRPGRLGRLTLCGYVTSGTEVTDNASGAADVVRPPASPSRMLGWRLGFGGLGPVHIGMTVAEIEQVTGRTMVLVFGDRRSCRLWRLRGAPDGLSLMLAHGRLARVDAFRGRWRSRRGIRIGDSERKVRRLHRGVRSEPHPYVPGGEYLIVGGRRRMIFEMSAAGTVMSFRGGRAREIGYTEGCA
jgi:hypothetical protein